MRRNTLDMHPASITTAIAELQSEPASAGCDAVSACNYQVIWCTKLTRPHLEGRQVEVEGLLRDRACSIGVSIKSIEVTARAVSLVIEVPPSLGIHSAVSKLKSHTSSVLRKAYPELRRKAPSLWNRMYMANTLGTTASGERLKQFLEQQRRA